MQTPLWSLFDSADSRRRSFLTGISGLLWVSSLAWVGCADMNRSAWLGLNTQIGQTALNEPNRPAATSRKADREINFDLVRELGVPFIRDQVMSWARIQGEPGARYDFSFSDDLARRAQSAHVELLAVCSGIPRWAAAGPGPRWDDFGVPARNHTDAFVAFVRAFVERYGGSGPRHLAGLGSPIRAYEFMEEMENVPPAEYAYWLRLFYTAVKKADRSALVVLGGLKSPGVKIADEPEGDYPTYFERLLAEPALQGARYPCFDVVAFHNFPSHYPGRTPFDDALAYLRRVMANRAINLPIWLTAYGFNSGSKQEDQQAGEIVKFAIRGRALGIERMYLHCLRDYRRPGDTGMGDRFGLVRESDGGKAPAKKPAFRSLTTLVEKLAKQPRVTPRAEGLYMLAGEGEPTYVIWKVDTYDASSFLIPGWWEVLTLNGKRLTRQGAEIKLTRSPIFLQRGRSPFSQ